MYELINWDDFEKVDLRSGTIVEATFNEKAKKPAYILRIDFGEMGFKTSSAQITENYSPDELIGKRVIAVMNFPPKMVAGVKSEVLVLATVCDAQSTLLISPDPKSINGSRIQ